MNERVRIRERMEELANETDALMQEVQDQIAALDNGEGEAMDEDDYPLLSALQTAEEALQCAVTDLGNAADEMSATEA